MMILNRQFLMSNAWHGENDRRNSFALHAGDLFYEAYDIVSLGTPTPGSVWGIDISHWNGPTDLATAKANGCCFVIIKAADGSVPTRWYVENRNRAIDVGLPWGAYVWLYPDNRVPISAQVDTWWNLFKNTYPPVAVHIDFEWTFYAGQAANPNAADLQKALDLFEAKSGKLCEVYTAKGYADTYLTGFQKPERYKWWIANYGVSEPNMPKLLVEHGVTWKKWQFTSSLDGSLAPSDTEELDGDYYNGDHYEFAYEYLGGEVPPDNGGSEVKYYKWNSQAANIRTGAGSSFPDRGDLINGDVIAMDGSPSGSWYPYKMARHADGTWVTLDDSTPLSDTNTVTFWSTNSYMVEVPSFPEPVPPPDPDPKMHVIEVYVDGVLEFRKELPCE